MSQERIHVDSSRVENKDLNFQTAVPTPTKTVKPANVRVIHGPHEQYVNVAGKSVGHVRKKLRDVFNISNEAEALIAGESVNDEYVLTEGDQLEFVKSSGVKGSTAADIDRIDIRWMLRCDLEEILKIENASFQFPWSEQHFINYLSNRNVTALAALCNEQVVGYVVYEIREKCYYLDNMAINPQFLRRKVATKIINKLKDKLGRRRNSIKLHVRESNLTAQIFFRNQGFIATEILSNMYDDCEEDAYLMEYFH